ncbi:hypothetical protein JTB14_021113 [Gonioctena quinquepunctata]|nr:hypothetical protein JTB14_021113 [Gonioctena quinquepunctata]
MDAAEYKSKETEFLKGLKRTREEIENIERQTKQQSSSILWVEERQQRLTAPNFGKICKSRPKTSCINTIKNLLYSRFRDDNLQKALEKVVEGRFSLREAEERYGIPRATLNRKYRGLHVLNPGRQKVLNEHEENAIVSAIERAANWGYPFTHMEIRITVKSYLDRKGSQERRFKENLPGYDWRLRTIFDWVNPNFIHEDRSLTKKEIRSFELDDKVLFRNYNGDKWLPGKVQQKNGTFTYTITSLDGQKMSRHIDQLLPRVSVEDEESNEIQNRNVAGLGAGVSNDTNDDSTTGIDLGQSTEDTSSRNTQMLRRSERNPRKPNYLRDFI